MPATGADVDDTPFGLETLVARVRAEYREMPGLRLTVAQAQRLWRLDGATCGAVLRALVDQGFLHETPHGQFVRTGESRNGV